MGRIHLVAVVVAAVAALYAATVSLSGFSIQVAFYLLVAAWLFTAAQAYRTSRRGDVQRHRPRGREGHGPGVIVAVGHTKPYSIIVEFPAAGASSTVTRGGGRTCGYGPMWTSWAHWCGLKPCFLSAATVACRAWG
jgi:hypothetical protein